MPRAAIQRVTIRRTAIEITLTDAGAAESQDRILTVPWTPPSPTRRREIVQGDGEPSSAVRPMRVKARIVLVEALRHAHRWLDELTRDSSQTVESLAAREGKTERSIRMTLSLAFVAPPIVKAAIEGRLPRGFGVKRHQPIRETEFCCQRLTARIGRSRRQRPDYRRRRPRRGALTD
jgi:hypothetical protein